MRQRGQASQVVITLFRGMKVGTHRCCKSEMPRMRGERDVLMRFMAAAHDFNRTAAEFMEFGKQRAQLGRIERIASGMRDDGNAAAAVDPAHGIAQARPLMRHEGRLACAKETSECGVHIPDCPLLYQEAREMRAAYHLRIGGKSLRAFEAAGNTQFVERGGHFPRTLDAPAARRGKPGLQYAVGGIDAEADDVYGLAAPGHGNFNAVDELHAVLARGRVRRAQAAGIIVVSQCEYLDAALGGACHQCGGSQGAVGKNGVAVQIVFIQFSWPEDE